jgi:CheY-like chemotaxis protein
MILTREGAEIKTAASASEALSVIGAWRPDILISDIAMPSEDGYSLMKKVRALPDRTIAAVPSIALTAHARVEDRQQALDAGFDYHVGKPFDRAKLIDAVGSAADLTAGARRHRPKSPAQGTRN